MTEPKEKTPQQESIEAIGRIISTLGAKRGCGRGSRFGEEYIPFQLPDGRWVEACIQKDGTCILSFDH